METIFIAYMSCELSSLVSAFSSLDVGLVVNIGGRCVSGRENVSMCTDGVAIISGGSDVFWLTQGSSSPLSPRTAISG